MRSLQAWQQLCILLSSFHIHHWLRFSFSFAQTCLNFYHKEENGDLQGSKRVQYLLSTYYWKNAYHNSIIIHPFAIFACHRYGHQSCLGPKGGKHPRNTLLHLKGNNYLLAEFSQSQITWKYVGIVKLFHTWQGLTFSMYISHLLV